MVGRLRSLVLVVLSALAVAAPAFASSGLPHPTRAETKWISALVDRYVKDVVLRENLADGWAISGPQMRGGISRRAFIAGHPPVQRLRLVGTNWAHAWTATCYGYRDCGVRNEWGLDVNLRVGHGQSAQVWDDHMTIDRIHGKWVVNALYTNAVIRLGRGHSGSCASTSCKITGLGDFGAGSSGGGGNGPLATIGGGWPFYALVGTLVGVPLSVLLGYLLYVRSRNRRAFAEYIAHSNRAT
jgi:hypothetical protein